MHSIAEKSNIPEDIPEDFEELITIQRRRQASRRIESGDCVGELLMQTWYLFTEGFFFLSKGPTL